MFVLYVLGIFGVSIEIVGRASFEALKMFDGYYASSKVKNLREIHFTNKDAPTFENMKRIFQFLLKDYQESSVDPEDLGNVWVYDKQFRITNTVVISLQLSAIKSAKNTVDRKVAIG